MGLMMMGAIQTNTSPTDLSKRTPIASLTTEPEAVFVRFRLEDRDDAGPVDDVKAEPGRSPWAAARPAAPTRSCSG